MSLFFGSSPVWPFLFETALCYHQLRVQVDFRLLQNAFRIQAIADCTTAACIAQDPEYTSLFGSERLQNFQLATGSLWVGDTELALTVRAEALGPDLAFALELLGMAENTRVRVQGQTFDKNGQVQGNLNYDQVITEPVNTLKFESMLQDLQTDINADP